MIFKANLFSNRLNTLLDANQGGGTGGNESGEGGKTYTQEDINKMMASKANEITEKLQKDFAAQQAKAQADWDAQKDDLIEQGKKMAGETATEAMKRKLDAQTEANQRLQSKLDATTKAQAEQAALNATQQELAKQGLPTDFAQYLTDDDETVRANNINVFADYIKQTVDKAADERLKGKGNPQAGAGGTGSGSNSDVTAEQFEAMGLQERMKFANDYPDDYKALMAKK